MKRWAPRSLAGQMALLLGAALLVAQLVNFALILNDRQRLSLAQNEGPAITRFVGVAGDLAAAAPEFHAAVLADASHRGARFVTGRESGVAETDRDPAIEGRLRHALAEQAVAATAVRAGTPGAADPGRKLPRDMQLLRLAVRRPDGSWLAGGLAVPRRDPWLAARLGGATLLVYLIVLGASLWLALRLARPLRDLTRAAEAFAGRTAPIEVRPRGPADLAGAIEAFNAMNRRVAVLLDEKDRMLGAIGHDLRTPLASLRIRVESMAPDEEREAAIAKIAEMTAMLEDILVLARAGRAREAAKRVDVTALVEAVVEEHRQLGQAVEMVVGARLVLAIQPSLVRRAVGNLIDNAVRYAGAARVTVAAAGAGVAIAVIDAGPGIPADELGRVLQPFYRGEGSRNRETGGSGLGLAIAQGIAESHGGTLRLSATDPHGLTAVLTLMG